jgi:hypothetical protein
VEPDGRCRAAKRDGSPCRAPAGADGFCRMHDPSVAGDVAAARARGRAHRGPKVSGGAIRTVPAADIPFGGAPATLDEAAQLSAWIIQAILTGKVDARTGREAVMAVNALKAVIATRDLSAHKLAALKADLLRELRAKA